MVQVLSLEAPHNLLLSTVMVCFCVFSFQQFPKPFLQLHCYSYCQKRPFIPKPCCDLLLNNYLAQSTISSLIILPIIFLIWDVRLTKDPTLLFVLKLLLQALFHSNGFIVSFNDLLQIFNKDMFILFNAN